MWLVLLQKAKGLQRSLKFSVVALKNNSVTKQVINGDLGRPFPQNKVLGSQNF